MSRTGGELAAKVCFNFFQTTFYSHTKEQQYEMVAVRRYGIERDSFFNMTNGDNTWFLELS